MIPVLFPLIIFFGSADPAEVDIDKLYPLDPQLRVLSQDIQNESYRTLVTTKMLTTDLAAEWQRVSTPDNAEKFLERHGGKDKVLNDPTLKKAYERRRKISADFLDLMRSGYARYKQVPPFDKGAIAEPAGTVVSRLSSAPVSVETIEACSGALKNWPGFRGPSGQGDVSERPLPLKWSATSANLAWKVDVPGRGHSSPVIWGNRLFVTTAMPKGTDRSLLCFDTAMGRCLWQKAVPEVPAETGLWPKNSYASSTPVTDGERVYVFFGSAGMVCFDYSGSIIWHHPLTVKTTHGVASSPILYKDLVILCQDQNQSNSLFLALKKKTGEVVWQETRSKSMGWATPVILHVGDHDELIVASNGAVRGYNPATGKELWMLKGTTVEVVPAIVAGSGMIYSASGRNGPTLALRPGGQGDVSKTHLVWRAVRGGPHVPSPILVKDRLYTANDTGIITCLNARTGALLFQERLNDTFSASPIACGDKIYCCGESGKTYVIRTSDTLDVLARNDLGESIYASPAVSENSLYIRTASHLVRIQGGP